jgi:F0F1-type ATP synthase membrane subunit b/b'
MVEILKALLEALLSFFLGRRQQDLTVAEARDEGRASGAAETAHTVAEVADDQARAALDGPDSVDALAASLRARAGRLGGGNGGAGLS